MIENQVEPTYFIIELALEKKYIDILKDSLRNKSEFIVTYNLITSRK